MKELREGANAGLSADDTFGSVFDVGGTCAVLLFGPNAHIDTVNPAPNSVLGRVRQVPGCAQTSFADVLYISTAFGLSALGVPGVTPVGIGRFDASEQDSGVGLFPGGCSNFADVIALWVRTGIAEPEKTAVIMQAGHNIGRTRASANQGCSIETVVSCVC